MLEDNYIEFDDYKKSLLDAFAYEFTKNKEDIKYPHFVFYVKEYIEKKYGKDLLTKGWLRIYTTLDPKLQDKAEQLVESQAAINEASFGGKNAALVSIENDTWKIITMVWGRDYFDTENKWNVNIITSKLQPGSSFKPFVYALAFDQQKIGTKTPVYDLETEFPWDYTPANFDGEFKGKMNIMEALNNSRNIPAVKMFFVAGWESKIISFMERLGVNSIWNFKKEYLENYGKDYTYGASLALWTGMMTPLELATAYTVFANMWEQVEITPIEKILDSKWLVVEEYEKKEVKEAISPSLAYIMNYVLSNTSTRPESWNDLLALSDRVVAAKTGTSTKQYGTGDDREIFARNLWTAWYTPQVTTVVWAGNTDWKELGEKWSGLRWAGPIWKKFMEYYHQGKEIKSWQKLPWVKEVYISRISWLLPPWWLGWSLITPSYFLNEPTNYDRSLIWYQVDELCNGKVTDQTPEAAIKPVTLLRFQSLKPENSEWENPVQKWAWSGWYRFEFGWLPNIIGYISGKECERSDLPSDIIIKTTTPNGASFVNGNNFIELAYRSNHPIIRLDVFLGDSLVSAIDVQEKTEWAYKWSFNIDSSFTGSTTLSIRAVDNQYYSEQEVKNINILGADTTPPVITISEPAPNPTIDISDRIRVKWYVTDRTDIKSINIFSDWLPIKTAISGRSFNHMLNWADLGLWSHIIEVQAVDSALNKNTSQFTINVIETEQVPAVEEATWTEETSEETWTEETTWTGETSQ